jgi:hypothetical protein
VRHVWPSAGFFGIHLAAYVIAGVLTQLWSKDIYHGPEALLHPVLRDVSEEAERLRQADAGRPAGSGAAGAGAHLASARCR